MAEDNPLEKVHDAFWTMLEASSEFTALVPSNNRIKYASSSKKSPDKGELGHGDYPQVRVVHKGTRPHLDRTSNGSSLVMIWGVEISTGDQRVSNNLEVEWAVFRALSTWQTHIKTLTWNSKSMAIDLKAVESRSDRWDETLSRRIDGWSTVWVGEGEAWFRTADLTPS